MMDNYRLAKARYVDPHERSRTANADRLIRVIRLNAGPRVVTLSTTSMASSVTFYSLSNNISADNITMIEAKVNDIYTLVLAAWHGTFVNIRGPRRGDWFDLDCELPDISLLDVISCGGDELLQLNEIVNGRDQRPRSPRMVGYTLDAIRFAAVQLIGV